MDLMNNYLLVVFVLLCAFGFPLNCELFYRIFFSNDKKLRNRPRYVIKLFMTFSSIFTMFINLMKIVHFLLPNDPMCRFFVSIINVSYVTFLFNTLMSLIDCFVAIVFPLWHRSKVTARRVCFGLIALNLAMAVALKWMFIFQVVPLRCAVPVIHAVNFRLIVNILFVLCCVFQIADFVLVWLHLPRSTHDEETETTAMRVHGQNNASINRMELKSIKQFLTGLIPFFCLSLPLLIVPSTFQMICKNKPNSKDVCNDFTCIIPFAMILVSLHAIVTPLMSLCLNKDLVNKPSPFLLFFISKLK